MSLYASSLLKVCKTNLITDVNYNMTELQDIISNERNFHPCKH